VTELGIRIATADDLPDVTAIYNHYIETTATTFDTEAYDWHERRTWFDGFALDSPHQLIVGTRDGAICGFASSRPLRPKAAYHRSVETSIYLAPDATGRGDGRRLYTNLLRRLRDCPAPVHRCYGIITQPNEASMALHEKLGYRQVAYLSEVGFKFGRYWDTVWMELAL